ncbi:uncharacterized protein LOC141866810 [Acropora palmata]|uniref:uncharacterized protein LOC141866810 n=1 Tax=Acropora palmata TaxID=6131 RepID=UPI003DA13632
MLGVFYGKLPLTGKEFFSSSNHMLVIFVSNATNSYTGFNASYSLIERKAGVNVAAIVVPLLCLVLVALLLVGVFLYCRRKKKNKGESGNSRRTVHFSNLTAHIVTSPSENETESHGD